MTTAMMKAAVSPAHDHRVEQNGLLGALLLAEFDRLGPHLDLVDLPLGSLLYRPGQQLKHAFFPTTAVVSLQYVTESGAVAETASVGSEGIVGIALFMGGRSMPGSAAVQTAGLAYRLDEEHLKQEFARGGNMQSQLLSYTQVLMTQIAQTSVCNCHHSLEQRLCRWLLLTLDRSGSPDLLLTHEQVASILGVRRESITEAAGVLQRAGYVNSRRGHIEVIDRSGLESTTCECYSVVKQEMRRLGAGIRN